MPSRARFLRISLPRAPAPTSRIRARASRFWSHQEINSNRSKRPSGSFRVSFRRSGKAFSWRRWRPPVATPRFVPSNVPGSDFWLETQDVTIADIGGNQGLFIQELPSAPLVVELVAHELAVGAVPGQVHLFDEDGDDPVDGRVRRQFHELLFVAGGVPDFNGNVVH